MTMKISNPTCLAAVGDRCGEGAVWSADESAVYWTDINRFLIHRLEYPSLKLKTWVFHEPVVALALTTDASRMLVALGSGLVWWWPETDARVDHGFKLAGWPEVRLNDGRPDPLGNFWVGSMFNNVSPDGGSADRGGTPGILHRITPDGAVTEWVRDIAISNTLCWSADRTRFYFADTIKNEMRVYDYDAATGDLGDSRMFLEGFERGLPDGSAIDQDGYIWNCRYLGGGIVRVAPDGQIDRFIELPTRNITTCTFGGPDLSTLFITSAANDTTVGDRLAGSLWMLETDVAGLPENKVRVP
jgi:sugar lactone lactonase YvrE